MPETCEPCSLVSPVPVCIVCSQRQSFAATAPSWNHHDSKPFPVTAHKVDTNEQRWYTTAEAVSDCHQRLSSNRRLRAVLLPLAGWICSCTHGISQAVACQSPQHPQHSQCCRYPYWDQRGVGTAELVPGRQEWCFPTYLLLPLLLTLLPLLFVSQTSHCRRLLRVKFAAAHALLQIRQEQTPPAAPLTAGHDDWDCSI